MTIPPNWNIPAALRVRVGQTTVGRQRALAEEGHLLLVLHKPPGPTDRSREGVLFWRNPAGEWQCSRGGPGPGMLRRHVVGYDEAEARLAHEYEAATGTRELFEVVEAVTPLLRAARNMAQALQTAREAVEGDAFLIEMRDLASDVERNFELLLEDTRNGIQQRMARKSEEQAALSAEALQASHRLNILAAWFFPLTAIASIFGMNVASGLNERNPEIFWGVLLVGCVLGYGMKSWVLGRKKG